MDKGDHLVAIDGLYTHHGVYLGPGHVAQYGCEDNKPNVRVEIVTEVEFASGRPVKVLNRPAGFSPEEIVHRVELRLGEEAYSLAFNNCEHFVNWCRMGRNESRQVDRVIERTASIATKVAVKAAFKGMSNVTTKSSGKLATKAVTRLASPWLVVADVIQIGTEIEASRRGASQERAERTGQVIGFGSSVAIGAATAGPIGSVIGCGVWILGEMVGKCLTATSRRDSPDQSIVADPCCPEAPVS